MAAAAGGFEPLIHVDRIIFNWYVDHHQAIIHEMLEGTGKKVKYYGGFAANIALGCPVFLPSSDKLMSCYTNGYDIVKEHASDIDGKILGVDPKDELSFLEGMLTRGNVAKGVYAAIQKDEHLKAAIMGATEKINRGPPYDLFGPRARIIRIPGEPRGSPIQYIVGHILQFMNGSETHYQLVLTGFYKEGRVWKHQVLSELTPTSEETAATMPEFINTSISELHEQFTLLHTNLNKMPEYVVKRMGEAKVEARKEKTANRIRALTKAIEDARTIRNPFKKTSPRPASASKTGSKGGGGKTRRRSRQLRFRRRRSVKN